MKKIHICSYEILKKDTFIVKFIEEWKDELILFIDSIDNKLKIFSSICPHFGGEIIYDKKENILRCKWHDWKFCQKTGKCLSYPMNNKSISYNFKINPRNLREYEYEIEKEEIFAINKSL